MTVGDLAVGVLVAGAVVATCRRPGRGLGGLGARSTDDTRRASPVALVPWGGRRRDQGGPQVGTVEAVTAAAAHLRSGGDALAVTRGLVAAGHGPDDDEAVRVALDVAARTGAPLADVLDRLADAAAAREEAEGRQAAAEAAPAATVRVLTWLPVVGLVFSSALGLDPARLVAGGAETMCVAAGVALAVLGRLWARALVRAAVRSGS